MLRTAGDLKGVTIEAMDGDIGSVQDLYFDDRTWTIRYFVVDTGTWLLGRRVLEYLLHASDLETASDGGVLALLDWLKPQKAVDGGYVLDATVIREAGLVAEAALRQPSADAAF